MKIKCPKCQQVFSVDEKGFAEIEFAVVCPNCSKKLKLRKPNETPVLASQKISNPEPRKIESTTTLSTLEIPKDDSGVDVIPTPTEKKGKSGFLNWAVVIVGLMVIGAILYVTLGRDGPPKEEIEKTVKAKAAADQASAFVYAKEYYESAYKLMNDGAEAVKKSDWKMAKKSYADAAVKFTLAAKEAPDNIKKTQDKSTAIISELKKTFSSMSRDKTVILAMNGKDGATFEKRMKEASTDIRICEQMIYNSPMESLDGARKVNAVLEDIMRLAQLVTEVNKDSSTIRAVCIEDDMSLRNSPSAQAGLLRKISMGEELRWTGETDVRSGLEYWKVEMSDGTSGWTLGKAVVPNATIEVLNSNYNTYERPDFESKLSLTLEAYSKVAVIEKQGSWVKVIPCRTNNSDKSPIWIRN